MLLVLTIAVCVLAALTTCGMLVVATLNYNPGSWETVVILGGWDIFVYVGIIATAFGFQNSRQASYVMVAGAATISLCSVIVLYTDLQPYFMPPSPTFRVMNCAGPIIQLGLPFLQWPALGVVAGVAYYTLRITPPSGKGGQSDGLSKSVISRIFISHRVLHADEVRDQEDNCRKRGDDLH